MHHPSRIALCSLLLVAGNAMAGFGWTSIIDQKAQKNTDVSYVQPTSQVAKETGYSESFIKRYFPPIPTRFHFDGFDASRFSQAKPYEHPRVYFTAKQLPAIRDRLMHTKAGKKFWQDVLHRSEMTSKSRKALDAFRKQYPTLGNSSVKAVWGSRGLHVIRPWASSLQFACFRDLIQQDRKQGRQDAADLTQLAGYIASDLSGIEKENNWQHTPYWWAMNRIGLAYDFVYPYMTADQRQTVRHLLTHATRGKMFIGVNQIPAMPACTTNWVPFHGSIVLAFSAIYGENGYDPTELKRIEAGLNKYSKVGVMPDGFIYEGLGKSQMQASNLVALANLGDPILASENVFKNVALGYFYLQTPWGKGFTKFDVWGDYSRHGSFSDIEMLHYAYPHNLAIDSVYRNDVGENYQSLSGFPAAFASSSSKEDMSFDDEVAAAAKQNNLKLAHFFNWGGVFCARSDWSSQSLQLIFEPRCVPGGHQSPDRDSFVFYGDGVPWIHYSDPQTLSNSKYMNIIMIDGKGQPAGGPHGILPGRAIDYQSNHIASFAVGSAKMAYSWRYHDIPATSPVPKGQKLFDNTFNSFLLHPADTTRFPWTQLPWADLPQQLSGKHVKRVLNTFNPVKHAFRTAGIVRGKHPYALILDDIEKDGSAHNYQWQAQLDGHAMLQSCQALNGDFRNGGQLILTGNGKRPKHVKRGEYIRWVRPAGGDWTHKRLLVRVLRNDSDSSASAKPLIEPFRWHYEFSHGISQKIIIPSHSVDPHYIVMLLPYRKGDTLPNTTWSGDHETLTIQWPGQADVYHFSMLANGRTVFKLDRNGSAVFENMTSNGKR